MQPSALGTAAATDSTDYATAAQGAKIDALGVITPASLSFADIQAAANQAAASGKRLWASGSITTNQTLVLTCDADLASLNINYTGSGVAVQVGDGTNNLQRKIIVFPRLVCGLKQTNGVWPAGTIGVQVKRASSCVFTVPLIQCFETGFYMYSNHGVSYCTTTIGHLDNNKRNIVLGAAAGGWTNQNTFIGGRLSHWSNEGTLVSGAAHILLETAANRVNNNMFLNASIEGDTAEWQIDCDGLYNRFTNCRYETTGGGRVRWGANAKSNQIFYGYSSQQLTHTYVAGALRNHTYSPDGMLMQGANPKSVVVLENVHSSTSPAISVLRAGAMNSGVDPATNYCAQIGAQSVGLKRETDVGDRIQLDSVNGRVYLGVDTAAPTRYLSAFGTSSIGIAAANLCMTTDNTYDIGINGYRPRDVMAGRYLRVGSIYLRDNAGALEKSTDGTTWTAV